MAGVNKVILVGRLGMEPEIKSFENGSKVARLRIATTESYTNKEGQRIEQTEWHTVTMWRHLADFAEKYLTKGSLVYIEGKLRTRTWKDAEGNDRFNTEIEALSMQMLGNRPGTPESATQERQQGIEASAQSMASQSNRSDQDDLPF